MSTKSQHKRRGSSDSRQLFQVTDSSKIQNNQNCDGDDVNANVHRFQHIHRNVRINKLRNATKIPQDNTNSIINILSRYEYSVDVKK
jgi:hypothetical protein